LKQWEKLLSVMDPGENIMGILVVCKFISHSAQESGHEFEIAHDFGPNYLQEILDLF
jgi:hypothetical protein